MFAVIINYKFVVFEGFSRVIINLVKYFGKAKMC